MKLWRGVIGGGLVLVVASVVTGQVTVGGLTRVELFGTAISTLTGAVYTEGDTDASIAGIPLLLEGAGDALVAAVGSATDGLLVNLGANNTVVAHMVSLFVDDADFTDGTSTHMLDGCVAESASPTTVTEGDTGACGMTLNRAQKVTLYNSSGTELTSGDATHDSPKATSGPQAMAAAVAHGANPTAVAAGDAVNGVANRAGVPFMIGGHPNIQTIEVQEQDADNGQTDTALVTCGTGCKVVVTLASVSCDPDTTDDTAIRVGFGAANVPAAADTPVAGIVLASDGVAPGTNLVRGSGSGIVGAGADGEDLRLTIGDPAGGSCNLTISYYTIES